MRLRLSGRHIFCLKCSLFSLRQPHYLLHVSAEKSLLQVDGFYRPTKYTCCPACRRWCRRDSNIETSSFDSKMLTSFDSTILPSSSDRNIMPSSFHNIIVTSSFDHNSCGIKLKYFMRSFRYGDFMRLKAVWNSCAKTSNTSGIS